MAENIISQKRLKEVLHYNPDTGVFTWKIKTNKKVVIGSQAGCLGPNGYTTISIDNKSNMAHRLAFLYMTGSLPTHQVDHINHIRNDNRWHNLRKVSRSENAKNQCRNKKNTSGVTGVTLVRNRDLWQSQIKVKGRTIFLGRFIDKNDAISARKSAEIKYGFHANHGAPK